VAIIFVLGLVVLATSIALVVHAIMRPRAATVGMVTQIGQYGFAGEVDPLDEEEARSLDRVATSIGSFLGKRLSWIREEDVRVRLVSAGWYSVTPARFLGYQTILALIFGLLTMWMGLSSHWSVLGLLVGVVLASALGWILPLAILHVQTRKRREAIEYELPELIDFLIVSIEAGVSLSGALRLSANQLRGPLGEEMRLALQEHNMGLSSSQTLENLGVRTDTAGMRMFVRAIIQGEALGISIGQVMRNLALEMRKRRKAAAEERAQKAPIKMVFPLVLLIFPAMFAVLVLPALINIGRLLP
jgi:tight adherence protein C